ncbi:MAG TPA: L-seryl-tRNA(Sec) selenium transferase [Actinomycetota bacterium]|nr:L-seryl-tRNA(Sec) selenium transferase [Actinomycetota bacterium]
MADPRRRLPSVDVLLRSEPARRAADRFGREVVRQAIRTVLDGVRKAPGGGDAPDTELLLVRAARLAARMSFGLSRVVNATGVVLHTNLGRAPLPAEAAAAAARAARGYTDLEVDRETGRRGRRAARAEFLLSTLTGAQDALVVNNNAAALLLGLAALASRKEVLVSRGELIEIGGEFRLPDIMRASGGKLVEVGTTNRTRLQDYREAVSPRTGLILKVHPSNYRVVGFAASPATRSLADLAGKAGIPLLYDIGSGVLDRYPEVPPEEPSAKEALDAGADLVCFSGDKLLGGPQAGIVAGRKELVERLRRHPMARALRVDKMTVAALEVVVGMYARGERSRLPTWEAVGQKPTVLRKRAAALAESLPGARVERGSSVAGGGSVPGYAIPTWSLRLPAMHPEPLAARLRVGNPPVFCRVEEDGLLFDLRTVAPDDDLRLERAIRYALSQER